MPYFITFIIKVKRKILELQISLILRINIITKIPSKVPLKYNKNNNEILIILLFRVNYI